MDFQEKVCRVLEEARNLLATLPEERIQALFDALSGEWRTRRLFFWARGRSFIVLQGFAMRLMHLGFEVYIVGEVTCPAVRPGDVLFVASGSGKTSSVVLFAEKAKSIGARVVAIVGRRGSPLEDIAHEVIAFSPEEAGKTEQLFVKGGGTRFEDALFIFFDALILALVEGQKEEAYRLMMERHANLE
ncbi:MAG: SIS domain-containing protein [Candidatus Caldatribacteriaceae bacterium]